MSKYYYRTQAYQRGRVRQLFSIRHAIDAMVSDEIRGNSCWGSLRWGRVKILQTVIRTISHIEVIST